LTLSDQLRVKTIILPSGEIAGPPAVSMSKNVSESSTFDGGVKPKQNTPRANKSSSAFIERFLLQRPDSSMILQRHATLGE
jgi:hypothetical protein